MELLANKAIEQRYRAWRRPQPMAFVGNPPFERLLGSEAWLALPLAVRRRFARKPAHGACIAHVGEVTECRISGLGSLLAQVARLVGGPLPLHRDTGVAACVSVTEDIAGGGQFWTRQYGRRYGFPQVIYSAKHFTGPTGIEEYLGLGLGIALRLAVRDGVLYFLSDRYFVRLGERRIRFPHWLAPGKLTIGHVDCGGGRFAFTLDLVHPWIGELIHQVAIFSDPEEAAA